MMKQIKKSYRKLSPKGRRTAESSSDSSLPLSGASIYILSSEEQDLTQEVAADATIEALGGDRVQTLTEATHLLFLCPTADLDQTTIETLATARQLGVPVVDVSWLERISGLVVGEHWSDIHQGEPEVIRKMNLSFEAAAGDEHQRKESHKFHFRRKKREKISHDEQCRRDKTAALGASIGETYASMLRENPDDVEESAIRRAMELSMLDWALVLPKSVSQNVALAKTKRPSPNEVLGVGLNATPAEIKAAYRKRALETHPDKGGKAGEFELVARSYRMLLHGNSHEDDKGPPRKIKSAHDMDAELRDHQILVNELFQNHGADLSSNVGKLEAAIDEMGLFPKDAGATNINENNERIRNSCFYLSLSASYLHGIGALSGDDAEVKYRNAFHDESGNPLSADEALIGETALDLKRTIEAAVVNVHPEWAEQGKVGEEVQAFSDFLVYVLDSPTILSDWAVAVFDTVSGFVDIYKGKNYPEHDQEWARSSTICLRYVPEHYQPLYPLRPEMRPTLGNLLECLDTNQVFYVVTDG